MFLFSQLRKLVVDDQAVTAVEYAVMLALILVAVMGAVTALGVQAGGWWGGIDTRLSQDAWGH